ncbi:MAG: hypothetical protein AAGE59_14705 [Cyanobacteria bacterium P01_F01_bin.86]
MKNKAPQIKSQPVYTVVAQEVATLIYLKSLAEKELLNITGGGSSPGRGFDLEDY